MNRRRFVTLLGAAIAAPAMPLRSAQAAAGGAVATYSRTLYGHAVFHARTRASLSAADLVTRLGVSGAQAEALMGEMATRGVLAPAMQGAVTVMRAANATSQPRINAVRAIEKLSELAEQHNADESPEPDSASDNAQPDPEEGSPE